MNTRGVLCAAGIAAATLVGCGSTVCGGHNASDETGAPHLESFYVLSQDKQIPGDPWTVVFAAHYTDENGDLGYGTAEFYLNSEEEPLSQLLDTVFRQSGLQLDETSGAVWMTLRFKQESVDDGSRIRLGLQLVDQAELRSNCFSLKLEFEVQPEDQAQQSRPSESEASSSSIGGGA